MTASTFIASEPLQLFRICDLRYVPERVIAHTVGRVVDEQGHPGPSASFATGSTAWESVIGADTSGLIDKQFMSTETFRR